MYTQKNTIFLQANKYRLTSKKILVSSVHKTENKVQVSVQHIWKSFGLAKKCFGYRIDGWIDIDPKYIETRSREIGCQGFQSDDCSYWGDSRGINKKLMPELIEYLNTKIKL